MEKKRIWDQWVIGFWTLGTIAAVLFLVLLPLRLLALIEKAAPGGIIEQSLKVAGIAFCFIGVPLLTYRLLFRWFPWTTRHLLEKIGYVPSSETREPDPLEHP